MSRGKKERQKAIEIIFIEWWPVRYKQDLFVSKHRRSNTIMIQYRRNRWVVLGHDMQDVRREWEKDAITRLMTVNECQRDGHILPTSSQSNESATTAIQ